VDTVVNYESCLEFLDDSGRLQLPLIPPAFAEAFMLSHLGCNSETIKDGILDDDEDNGEDFSSMDVENENWDQCFTGIEDILSKDIDIESLDIFNGKVEAGLDKVDAECVKLESEELIADSGLDSEGASNDATQDTHGVQDNNCRDGIHGIKAELQVKAESTEDTGTNRTSKELSIGNLPTSTITVANNPNILDSSIVIKTEKTEAEPVAITTVSGALKRPLVEEPSVVKSEPSLAKKLALSCTCAKCTKSGSNKLPRATLTPAVIAPTTTVSVAVSGTNSQVLYITNNKVTGGTGTRAISCGEVNPTVQALLSAAAAANAMLSKQKAQQQAAAAAAAKQAAPVVLSKQGSTSSMVLLPPAKSRQITAKSTVAKSATTTTTKSSRSRQPVTESPSSPAESSTSASTTSSSTSSSSASSTPPSDLTCVACTKTFSRRYNLRRHQMSLGHWAPISHPNPITFKSTRLEQSMPAEQAAPRREEIHDDEKPFLCTACSMRFTLKSSLRRHQIKFNHVNTVKQEEGVTTTTGNSSSPLSPAQKSDVARSSPAPTIISSSSVSTPTAPVFNMATIAAPGVVSSVAATLASTLSSLAAKVTTPAPISATLPPPLTLSQPSVRPNPDLVAIATPSPITVAKASPSLASQLHSRLAVAAAAASSGTPFTISASPSAISALTIATPPPMMTTTLTPPSTPPQPVQPSASPQPPSTISLMIIPYLKMKGGQAVSETVTVATTSANGSSSNSSVAK
jgi:hypothetical protein